MRWKDEGGLGRACGLGSAWAYVASRMSEGWGGRGGSGGPGEAAPEPWSGRTCVSPSCCPKLGRCVEGLMQGILKMNSHLVTALSDSTWKQTGEFVTKLSRISWYKIVCVSRILVSVPLAQLASLL